MEMMADVTLKLLECFLRCFLVDVCACFHFCRLWLSACG